MSIAMPRSSRLVMEGIAAQWIIEPTTEQTLWETTLNKFGRDDISRLTQHIVQVQVTGHRSLARQVELRATEYGINVRMMPDENGEQRTKPSAYNPFSSPLTIRATIPAASNLHLTDLYGSIALGDMEGDLRVRLAGRTTLRAGHMRRAALTLRENSRAIISRVDGDADVLLTGRSRALLNGRLGNLRAVVEKEGRLEILAPLNRLHVEVNDHGLIHAKNAVGTAQCNVFGEGLVHIAELRSSIVANTQGNGRVDIKKKPSYVPVQRGRATQKTGS